MAFAFDYDVNMILKDLYKFELRRLKEKGFVTALGYRIEHRPKKWFQLSTKRGTEVKSIRIYDVFSFFATSLVKAIRLYAPEFDDIDRVESGKEQRSGFGYHELDSIIIPYWRIENQGLIKLLENFRRSLYSAGIKITSWHGPGAIATFLFSQHKMKSALDRPSDERIEYASRCAYAGGRFEPLRAGTHHGKVYSYDVNSAYPYAISTLPDMRTGIWLHSTDADHIRDRLMSGHRMMLVRLSWEPTPEYMEAAVHGYPMPLFHRAPSGTVAFPVIAENWYHSHEARWVCDSPYTEIMEAFIYEDDGTYPFAWVAEMYEQRLKWKREGNPAQLAAKLGPNSLYGKMAQRIGWNEKTGEPPPWHCLENAGYTTSWCRSAVWTMMVDAASTQSLISVETDGVYTSAPVTTFSTGLGEGLGEIKAEEYDGMMLIQSGMYWLKKEDVWLPPKTRGIPQKRMSAERAVRALRYPEKEHTPIIRASHTSFIGYGAALHRGDMESWRTWRTDQREYVLGGDGKRFHNPVTCTECRDGVPFDEGMHELCVGRIEGRDSTPHALPWRKGRQYADEIDTERMWNINA